MISIQPLMFLLFSNITSSLVLEQPGTLNMKSFKVLISFSKEFLGLLRVTLDHHCRFRLFRKPRFLVQRKHKISVSPSLHLLAVKCSTCVVSKRRGTCTVQVPAKLNLELHAHQLTNEWRFK